MWLTKKRVVFDWAIVDGKYVPIGHPGLRKKDDGSYELAEEDSAVQSLQGEEKDEVESLDDEQGPSEVKWNNATIQQVANKFISKIETIEHVQREDAFELDQLSEHELPDSHVHHERVAPFNWRPVQGRCKHSKPVEDLDMLSQTYEFALVFTDAYNEAGGVLLNHKIRAAYHSTKKYVDVWNSEAALQFISVHLMNIGVDCLLEGNCKAASHYASIVYCLEQHVACNIRNDRPTINWPKINELYFDPDEHTLLSFFKKRISCSCLDDMYEQVKSVKKLGICYNVNCPLPDRKAIRSFTKCCSRCRRVNYCSRECQEDNWRLHKIFCDGYVQRDLMVMTVPLDDKYTNTCTEVSASEDGESHNTCVEASISG